MKDMKDWKKRQISFVFFPTEEIIVPEKFRGTPDKLLELMLFYNKVSRY